MVVAAAMFDCPESSEGLRQGSLSVQSLRDENSHEHNPTPLVRPKYDVEAGGLVDSQVVAQSKPKEVARASQVPRTGFEGHQA